MSFIKEVFCLRRKVGKLTDGQVSLGDLRPDELSEGSLLDIFVEPNAGMYKGGRFTFLIFIPDENACYKQNPVVFCNCDIFHPNIDTTTKRVSSSITNVCLNMFDIEIWDDSFGLEGIVHGILFLLHNPNFESPFSPYFEPCDCEAEIESVKQFMNGEEVEGLKLSRNFENFDGRDDESNDSNKEINKEAANIIITNYEVQSNKIDGKKVASTNIDRSAYDADSVKFSNTGDYKFDKEDTESSKFKTIIIDGEVFLAPNDDHNERDTVETTVTGTTNIDIQISGKESRDEQDKKEKCLTNDIGIVDGKKVVLNLNEIQNIDSITDVSFKC